MKISSDIIVPGQDPADVFAFVSNFTRAHEWRPGVIASTMEPAGPMVEGSAMHEVLRMGPVKVRTTTYVDKLEPGRSFTFRHRSGPLPVGGEYRVEPGGLGTRVIYTLELDTSKPYMRLLAPMMRRSLEKTVRGALAGLRATFVGTTAGVVR